jgi:DNA-binding CsgD family transcriptional regulator
MLGLKHLAYMRLEKDKNADSVLTSVLTTYSREWQLRYLARGYAEVDPLFAACRRASSSFDWRAVRESSPQSAPFFADAADHGLGSNGLTIPVPAKPSGYGMVSFNSDLADADWEAFKLQYMGKLEVVACLVDSAAGRNAKLPSKRIDLSNREHQALTWAARGRTASEIGDIMGVSYATARSHLEGARRRLACENVTHAVATALAIGLISPTALKGFDPIGYSGKEESGGTILR